MDYLREQQRKVLFVDATCKYISSAAVLGKDFFKERGHLTQNIWYLNNLTSKDHYLLYVVVYIYFFLKELYMGSKNALKSPSINRLLKEIVYKKKSAINEKSLPQKVQPSRLKNRLAYLYVGDAFSEVKMMTLSFKKYMKLYPPRHLPYLAYYFS